MEEYTEYLRSHHSEVIEEVCSLLDTKKIDYKVSNTSPIFDITTIGMERDTEIILSVPTSIYHEAEAILQSYYADSELPPDHFLYEYSESEILEIIAKEHEWNPYIVFHAQNLAKQNNWNLQKVQEVRDTEVQQKLLGSPIPVWIYVIMIIANPITLFLLAPPMDFRILFPIFSPVFCLSPVLLKEKMGNQKFATYRYSHRMAAVIIFIINLILCTGIITLSFLSLLHF